MHPAPRPRGPKASPLCTPALPAWPCCVQRVWGSGDRRKGPEPVQRSLRVLFCEVCALPSCKTHTWHTRDRLKEKSEIERTGSSDADQTGRDPQGPEGERRGLVGGVTTQSVQRPSQGLALGAFSYPLSPSAPRQSWGRAAAVRQGGRGRGSKTKEQRQAGTFHCFRRSEVTPEPGGRTSRLFAVLGVGHGCRRPLPRRGLDGVGLSQVWHLAPLWKVGEWNYPCPTPCVLWATAACPACPGDIFQTHSAPPGWLPGGPCEHDLPRLWAKPPCIWSPHGG